MKTIHHKGHQGHDEKQALAWVSVVSFVVNVSMPTARI